MNPLFKLIVALGIISAWVTNVRLFKTDRRAAVTSVMLNAVTVVLYFFLLANEFIPMPTAFLNEYVSPWIEQIIVSIRNLETRG